MFGVGSEAYGTNFNAVARAFDKHLGSLGGLRVLKLEDGDVDEGTIEKQFEQWSLSLLEKLRPETEEAQPEVTNGGYESAASYESDDDDDDSETYEDANDENLVDVEDMGGQRNKLSEQPIKGGNKRGFVRRQPLPKQAQAPVAVKDGPKEMVTPVLRASLEKQVLAPLNLTIL